MAISRDRDQKPVKKVGSKYGSANTQQGPREVLSWASVSAERLKLLIAAVTETGDAVTLGTTRQGGLALTILEGDERHKEYSSDVDDMEQKMRAWTDAALAGVPQQVRDRLIEMSKGF